VIRGGKIEAVPARAQADEEERTRGIRLEAFHALLPVARSSIEVLVHQANIVQPFLHETQKARELREHERLVSFRYHFCELIRQHIELRTVVFRALRIDESGV